MVFGEIVEPSTRALLEEEEDYFKRVEWANDAVLPPNTIKRLLITETKFINRIVSTCVLDSVPQLCRTKLNEVAVYRAGEMYVVTCDIGFETSVGEVMEAILPWVKCSSEIYALTSASAATLRNADSSSEIVLRMLSTEGSTLVPKLEVPNLVSGIGASVLSFALHADKKCALFVAYVDFEPVDSKNAGPVLNLLEKIGVHLRKRYVLQEKVPSSNLYM